MFMLADKPPLHFSPFISVKSIDFHDGEPLLDVATKQQIISQGSWNSRTNLKHSLKRISVSP
jgi:hypothetical protein